MKKIVLFVLAVLFTLCLFISCSDNSLPESVTFISDTTPGNYFVFKSDNTVTVYSPDQEPFECTCEYCNTDFAGQYGVTSALKISNEALVLYFLKSADIKVSPANYKELVGLNSIYFHYDQSTFTKAK